MSKVIITAQVKDPVKWEAGFRTHGDVFRSYSLRGAIQFSIDGNSVAICMEPENMDTFKEMIDAPVTAESMESDGVIRETVKFYFLDKDLKL